MIVNKTFGVSLIIYLTQLLYNHNDFTKFLDSFKSYLQWSTVPVDRREGYWLAIERPVNFRVSSKGCLPSGMPSAEVKLVPVMSSEEAYVRYVEDIRNDAAFLHGLLDSLFQSYMRNTTAVYT